MVFTTRKTGEKGFELFRSKKDYSSICSLSHNFMAEEKEFEPVPHPPKIPYPNLFTARACAFAASSSRL